MAPFYGWDSTASRLGPLQGGSLLFTIKIINRGKWSKTLNEVKPVKNINKR